MRLERDGRQTAEGVTAILAQNSDPFTYFGSRPVRVCEDVEIDDGTLSVAVLRRASQRDMGPIIARACSPSACGAAGHRQIDHFDGVTEARIDVGSRPTPTASCASSRSRSTATSSAIHAELDARRSTRAR